jgi:hypothetical protein
LATADGFFCSLVPLMCSEILVEMWYPIWLSYTLPQEHGIL